jgi:hypothetical protein
MDGQPVMFATDRIIACALFAIVFLIYLASPNATPYDSRWTVYTATSLIHQGDADLNEYLPKLEAAQFYGIECVLLSGERIHPVTQSAQCTSGRLYNFYPVAVPLISVPAVLALELATTLTNPISSIFPPGVRRAFLAGDLIASSMFVELLLASALVAGAAVVVFAFARQLSDSRTALFIALVFAFATPAWSTGSRALWMHGFSMLLLPAALWAMWKDRWAVAGSILLLGFFVRPTNVVPLICAGVWTVLRGRRETVRFLLGGFPVAVLFIAINFAMYSTPLAPYFFVQRGSAGSLAPMRAEFGEALLGNLISPGRGLFVYSPVFLFSIFGLCRWLREPTRRPLAIYVTTVFLLHYLLISSFEDWFGGHSYGPRYFSDLASLLTLPLLPVAAAARWPTRSLAVAALAVSLFMHAHGAWCWPCLAWNRGLHGATWRVWDWSDPPFLRNFVRVESGLQEP